MLLSQSEEINKGRKMDAASYNLPCLPNSSHKSSILLNLILLCGDVNVNPGPNWKYACGLCKKPVKSNQRGIQCDSCDVWIHTRCLGMNNDEYQLLANSSCWWICPGCHLPNFAPKLLDLSSNTLNLSNSYDILSDSVADTNNNPSRSNPATSSPKRNMKPKLKGMIINCNGCLLYTSDAADE